MVHPGTMETFCRRAGSQDGGLGSLGAGIYGDVVRPAADIGGTG
jgi:hypothetical protein